MRTATIIICFVFSTMLGSTSMSCADDLYLHIDGIPGESVDDQHTNWINLLSWEWQASNTATLIGGSSGDTIIRPLIVQKYIDQASPLLALSVLTGSIINSVILHSVMEEGDRHTRVQIIMQGVIISNIAPAGTSGESAMESLALRFSTICYRYTPIDASGSAGTYIEKCFDVLSGVEP